MNGHGQSDGPVVPANLPNKAAGAVAEVGEGRSAAEGNTGRLPRAGHRAGSGVLQGLDRVREVARRDKDARFTALREELARSIDEVRAPAFVSAMGASQGAMISEIKRQLQSEMGLMPLTVTVSASAPTFITMSRRAAKPALTLMSSRTIV